MTSGGWLKISPKSSPFIIKKRGITKWPFDTGWNPGQRALTHRANVEAIANFRKALQLLNALPETPERTKQEIDIQLALGIPLIAVKGYTAAENSRRVFARAYLVRAARQHPGVFPGLVWLVGKSLDGRKERSGTHPMADEFLSRARALSDPVLLMVAHRVMGSTLLTVGDFASSATR